MKTIRSAFFLCSFLIVLSSCSLFNKNKYGCGDNGGRNVGAEKVLDGGTSKKTKKFNS